MVVIVGEDFLELGQELAEIVQDLLAAGRAGQIDVLTDDSLMTAGRYLPAIRQRVQTSWRSSP